jgi:hypothetical protein
VSFGDQVLPGLSMSIVIGENQDRLASDLAFDVKAKQLEIDDLCGPIEHSLSQEYPFLELDPVTGTLLLLHSDDISLVGEYDLFVKAMLTNFPLKEGWLPLKVILVHPCAISQLYPVILEPMNVSIYKTGATLQYFDEARNAYEMAHSTPGICGDRNYTVSDPLCSI